MKRARVDDEDHEKMLALLELKQLKLEKQLKSVQEDIKKHKTALQVKKERSVPNVPLSELKTVKEVEAMLAVYPNKWRVLLDSTAESTTLQQKIEDLVCDIDDSNAMVYYDVRTKKFVVFDCWSDMGHSLRMKYLDQNRGFVVCVFAK